LEDPDPNIEPAPDSAAKLVQTVKEGKLKLLIVEDSKDVAAYLTSLLAFKYEIHKAWNGVEGLELAVHVVPDLIISDVMMPVMDGFTLCQRLKQDIRTSHIPIILLTARNETASRMEGLSSGADAYLGKPFNKEELFIRIDKLITLRRELRDSLERMTSDPEIRAPHDKEYAFLKRVREILESHLSEDDFGIEDLSASMGMSRSQLYRKFSALTDTSVHQFIRNLRLTKARELLRSSDLNVTEVAYDTGFKNPSHFSRIYSEHFGIPPSKEKMNAMA
jgi:YesN/AraC family two-component response regulator